MHGVEGATLITPMSYLLTNLKKTSFNIDVENGVGWMGNPLLYVGTMKAISPQKRAKELIGPVEKACPGVSRTNRVKLVDWTIKWFNRVCRGS